MGARRAAVVVCAVLGLLAAPPPPANARAATGGFTRIHRGDLPDPVQTDGVRWAAYRVPGRGTHVIDTRRGREYVARTPPGRCEIAALGGGLLMWQCQEARGAYPVLLDLARRRRVPVAGVDSMFADVQERSRDAPYNIEIYRVGEQWVGGSMLFDYGYHNEVVALFALNWHTGELRYDEPQGKRVVPDYDTPGLTRHLCRPMTRSRDSAFDQPIWERFDYRRPYGVRGVGVTRLLLERCGHPTRVLARCHAFNGCADGYQLGSGMVSWVSDRRAFLYEIRGGGRTTFGQRAFTARGPEDSDDAVLFAAHTAGSFFVSVPIDGTTRDGEYVQTRWRLYGRAIRRRPG